MRSKHLAALLCAAAVVSASAGVLPNDITGLPDHAITASAETVKTVTSNKDITINSDTTLTGTASNSTINVTGSCTITLDGLNLTNTSGDGKCGIAVKSGTVNIIIKGTNKITAGGQYGHACPIGVYKNATLVISGYNDKNAGNELNLTGTTSGKAAIGGAWEQFSCGNITIKSGTINAKGGGYGASVIGKGGNLDSDSTVTLCGGIINTTLNNTQKGATEIGGGSMTVSYAPNFQQSFILNGVDIPLSQNGDTYTITDTDRWNYFCDCLTDTANYNYFSGKTVLLDADISVTRIAGSDQYPFKGTFDGQGHKITENISGDSRTALFGTISGATIKDLAVDGSVRGGIHCAGLVSFVSDSSTNLIENVTVGTTVTTTKSYCGGILGHGGINTHNTLRGCSFTGSIKGGTHVGVLYGWGDTSTPVIEDCVEAGSGYTSANVDPVGLISNWGTVTDTYYTNKIKGSPSRVTSRGALKHLVNTGENVYIDFGTPTDEYNVGGIMIYENGVGFNGIFYSAKNQNIALLNTPPEGYIFKEYTATAGTVTNDTLTMPDSDVTVNGVFEKKKYTVTWKNGDAVLKTDEEVEHGTVPTYDGDTPKKPCDTEHYYTFSGWSPEVAAITDNATYTAQFTANEPTYTITIPAAVDLKSTDTVDITAENVMLDESQSVVVTLDDASNTEKGSTEFSAKDPSGTSVVSYTISTGGQEEKAIGVTDTVARFTSDPSSQRVSLKFTADAGNVKHAGIHSEKLTFGVALVQTQP